MAGLRSPHLTDEGAEAHTREGPAHSHAVHKEQGRDFSTGACDSSHGLHGGETEVLETQLTVGGGRTRSGCWCLGTLEDR